MKPTSEQLLASISQTGMIPVFNHKELEVAKAVLDAAYTAGIRVFEFTNRQNNALEVFKGLKIYAEKYKDMYLGIGTIFTVQQVKEYLYADADFIVSPALIPEVAKYCQMKGVFWVPGCATVTEVFQAQKLGAVLVKAFPGNLLGVDFIKAVLSVMPGLKIMPTGGVEPTEENLQEWFRAGVTCVGMGSQLIKKDLLQDKKYDELNEKFTQTISIIKNINQKTEKS
ncbi:bifunctional 4-hydroxy-2-oxoglutarate aldolase/2-dehydro-3-deoxy-phosphogluconate aldolase [Anditalea andensis]|uniref:Ketohydroxyglutarate aldolase n=1 Tax=Anditalea andensis TaxID=1048983 RepID=A0A074LPD1_9BACT|nr:bifunctional 4-hydroxy-2-oxoglutarate aldolase/2-dehydro-3-deoxy-phosphogluconate aldolase [Anditalea andensis]KEO75777.1 ketohydroxyglutarate aldolase [Anditalea andensis]